MFSTVRPERCRDDGVRECRENATPLRPVATRKTGDCGFNRVERIQMRRDNDNGSSVQAAARIGADNKRYVILGSRLLSNNNQYESNACYGR